MEPLNRLWEKLYNAILALGKPIQKIADQSSVSYQTVERQQRATQAPALAGNSSNVTGSQNQRNQLSTVHSGSAFLGQEMDRVLYDSEAALMRYIYSISDRQNLFVKDRIARVQSWTQQIRVTNMKKTLTQNTRCSRMRDPPDLL